MQAYTIDLSFSFSCPFFVDLSSIYNRKRVTKFYSTFRKISVNKRQFFLRAWTKTSISLKYCIFSVYFRHCINITRAKKKKKRMLLMSHINICKPIIKSLSVSLDRKMVTVFARWSWPRFESSESWRICGLLQVYNNDENIIPVAPHVLLLLYGIMELNF